MLLGERAHLLALDHLEARVPANNLVKRVRDALLRQRVLALHVALLLAGVQHDEAWNLSLLKVEDGGEVGLSRHIEPHEVEDDAALDLARELLFDAFEGLNDLSVRAGCIGDDVDDAENAVLHETDVVAALRAQVRHRLGEPRPRCTAFNCFLFLCEDESLRVSVDELEKCTVAHVVTFVDDWLLLAVLEDQECWVLLDLVLCVQ